MKKLYKSSSDKMISGVCGGIGEYFNTDATLIRLAAAVFACITFGTAAFAYIIASIIIPNDAC